MSRFSNRQTFQEKLNGLVDALRTEIHSGIRQSGSYLPSESALAKEFGLSNKSVRKGLEVLVEEGLITKIDRVGSLVNEPARERVTVHWGCSSTLPTDLRIDELIQLFEEKNPDIAIRRITLDYNNYICSSHELIMNGMLDGVMLNSLQFQEWLENGWSDYLDSLENDRSVYPIIEDAFVVKDSLKVRPITFSPVVLCYNPHHFQEVGIPEPDSYWSWEDLIHAAEQLARHRGRHGIYFMPASENRFSVFLLQGGMETTRDAEGKVRLSERMMESLRIFSKLVRNSEIFPVYIAQENDDTIQLFQNEQVSMILATYYNLNKLTDAPFSYNISPVPSLHKGEPQKTLLLTIGAAVVRRSRVKEAARRFTDFLASEEAQAFIREHTLSIPVKMDVKEPEIDPLYRPSRYRMYRETFPSYRTHAELGLRLEELRLFRRSLRQYWAGIIEEAELHQQLAELLDRNSSSVQKKDTSQ
ncbi:extracellular solute-binding protein [Paenibacillus marinisediminis]